MTSCSPSGHVTARVVPGISRWAWPPLRPGCQHHWVRGLTALTARRRSAARPLPGDNFRADGGRCAISMREERLQHAGQLHLMAAHPHAARTAPLEMDRRPPPVRHPTGRWLPITASGHRTAAHHGPGNPVPLPRPQHPQSMDPRPRINGRHRGEPVALRDARQNRYMPAPTCSFPATTSTKTRLGVGMPFR
jgi:hypothetical protein